MAKCSYAPDVSKHEVLIRPNCGLASLLFFNCFGYHIIAIWRGINSAIAASFDAELVQARLINQSRLDASTNYSILTSTLLDHPRHRLYIPLD